MSDPYREWDAAYLVGALSAKDRRVYEEHLHTCEECSAGVASLAGIPGVLAALPADRALATITADPPNRICCPVWSGTSSATGAGSGSGSAR